MSALDELFEKPLDKMGYDEIGYFFTKLRPRAAMEWRALKNQMEMLKRVYKNPSAQAKQLRAIPSDKRAQASRENGKKGGRPKKITE